MRSHTVPKHYPKISKNQKVAVLENLNFLKKNRTVPKILKFFFNPKKVSQNTIGRHFGQIDRKITESRYKRSRLMS